MRTFPIDILTDKCFSSGYFRVKRIFSHQELETEVLKDEKLLETLDVEHYYGDGIPQFRYYEKIQGESYRSLHDYLLNNNTPFIKY